MSWLTLVTAAVLLAGSCQVSAAPSAGCGQDLPHGVHPGHSHMMHVDVEDPVLGYHMRHFRVYVPTSYDMDTPLPVVMDYHGFTGNSHWQEQDSRFIQVAEDDVDPFLVVTPDGMADNAEGWGSWNVSRTNGPLGPPCNTSREVWGNISCYDSCPSCSPVDSCDFSSCYDDVTFTRTLVGFIADSFCVETASVHQSGVSNGGMFSYYMASQLSDIFASIAPVAASPFIGFGDLPTSPISLFDIHGWNDDTIPIDLDHSEGEGPSDSVISWDGYYYEKKNDTIAKWTANCASGPEVYPTPMDGQTGWECWIWSGCWDTAEVVSCTADHGHDYPFGEIDAYVEGTYLMWDFMRNHTKTEI